MMNKKRISQPLLALTLTIMMLTLFVPIGRGEVLAYDTYSPKEKVLPLPLEDTLRYQQLYQAMLENAPELLLEIQLTPEWYVDNEEKLSEEEMQGCSVHGLPTEEGLSQEDALYYAYRLLESEYNVSQEQLLHLMPEFSYELSNPDVENCAQPMWSITLRPFDSAFAEIYTVNIYASDGSIALARICIPVG